MNKPFYNLDEYYGITTLVEEAYGLLVTAKKKKKLKMMKTKQICAIALTDHRNQYNISIFFTMDSSSKHVV